MADVGIRVNVQGADEARYQFEKLTDAQKRMREEEEKRTRSLKELKEHTAQLTEKVQKQMVAEQAAANAQAMAAASNERMITAVKGLVVAYGLYKTADYIKETAMLNARYEELGVVMNVVGRNAGYTSAQMDLAAKGVQSMGITMLESRNAVVKMVDAQIGLNNAQRLARIAQDAAVIGNINSSEALQRMTHAIQSGSTLMLRHIGINVSFENAYQRMAKELKTTTSALSEHQKMQARVNAVMEDGEKKFGIYEEAMTTAGKQLRSMERYTQDFGTVFGGVFNDALYAGVMGLTSVLKDSNKEINDLASSGTLQEWAIGLTDTLALVADGFISAYNIIRIAGRGIATTIAMIRGPGAVGFDINDPKQKAAWIEAMTGGPPGQTETERYLGQMSSTRDALGRLRTTRTAAEAERKLAGDTKVRTQFAEWLGQPGLLDQPSDIDSLLEGPLGEKFRQSLVKTTGGGGRGSKKTPEDLAKAEVSGTKAYLQDLLAAHEITQDDYVSMLDYMADKYGKFEKVRADLTGQATKERQKMLDEETKDSIKRIAAFEKYEKEEDAKGTAEYKKNLKEMADARDREAKAELRQINETTYLFREHKMAALEELERKYLDMGDTGAKGLQRVSGEMEALKGSTKATGVIVQDVGFDMGKVWQGVHTGLTTAIGDIARYALGIGDNIKSLGEAIKGFFLSIVNSVIDMFAKIAANKIFEWIFGGGGASAGGGILGSLASGAASGAAGAATGGGGGGGILNAASTAISKAFGGSGSIVADIGGLLGIGASGAATTGMAGSAAGMAIEGAMGMGGATVGAWGGTAAGAGAGAAGAGAAGAGASTAMLGAGAVGAIYLAMQYLNPDKPDPMDPVVAGVINSYLTGPNKGALSGPIPDDVKAQLRKWFGTDVHMDTDAEVGWSSFDLAQAFAFRDLHKAGYVDALHGTRYSMGTDMIVSKPTFFSAGEVGTERVTVSPIGAAHRGGGDGGVTIAVSGLSLLDNYAARKLAYELKRYVNA